MSAWKSGALAAVCEEVCAFLESVLQSGSRVSRFKRTEGLEVTQFSQVARVLGLSVWRRKLHV